MVMDVAFTPDLIEDAPTRFRRSDFPTSSVATLPRLGDESEVKTSTLNDLPTAGEKFGEFAIVAEIGKGAFSRVYLAHQIDMAHRLVALKVTLDYFDDSQTLAQLQHTNIMPIYSVHSNKNLRALVMPYFGSTTLAHVSSQLKSASTLPESGRHLVDILAQRRSSVKSGESPPTVDNEGIATLSDFSLAVAIPSSAPGAQPNFDLLSQFSFVDAVLWIGARLADGLAHAHARDVIHRDIKPANVLLADDGRPMLLDFNLSTDAQSTVARGGTLPYMSPEQLQAYIRTNYEPITGQADVYSLGLVLYELLTGQPAFVDYKSSEPDTIRQMLTERKAGPVAANLINPAVSPAVNAIINKCLAFDRKDRYRNATELREDLERQLASRPLLYAKEPSRRERLQKWTRRHPSATSISTLSAVAVVAMLGLGYGVLHYWQESSANSTQVAKKDAEAKLKSFLDDTDQTRYQLVRPPEGEIRSQIFAETLKALSTYGLPNRSDWQAEPSYALLAPIDRDRLQKRLAELLSMYVLAKVDTLKVNPSKDELATVLQLSDAHGSLFAPSDRPRFWHSQREQLLALSGDAAGASAAAAAAKNAPSDSAMDRYLTAVELCRTGKYAAAIKELEKTVRDDAYNFGAWLVLGNCQFALEREAEAIESYTVCVGLCPKSHVALACRGSANSNARNTDAALRDFEQAKERLGHSPELSLDIAKCLVTLKQYDDASSVLNEVAQDENYRLRALLACAYISDRKRNNVAAAADRKAVCKMPAHTAMDYNSRGLAKLKFKEHQGALEDFRLAEELNPTMTFAYLNQTLALIRFQPPRLDEATKVLDRMLKRLPDSPKGLAARATYLARLGRVDEALCDVRHCMELNKSPWILYQMAGVYALTSDRPGHSDNAIRLIKAAIALQSSIASKLEGDRDLDSLRELPEFIKIAEAVKALQPTD